MNADRKPLWAMGCELWATTVFRFKHVAHSSKPIACIGVHRCLSAVALSCLLTACTVGPNYERPGIDAPQNYRFEDAVARDTVNTTWWTQYNDQELNRLIGIALVE